MAMYWQTAADLWRGKAPVLYVLAILALVYAMILALPGEGVVLTGIVSLLVAPAMLMAFGKVRLQLRDSAGLPGALLLMLAALVVLVSGAIKAVGALVPTVAAIPPYEPPPPKVAFQGGVFVVEGAIDYRILSELKEQAAQHPLARTVVLNSEGGHARAGRAIGLYIAREGMNTHVDGHCFSACTLAFAGGIQRQLGPVGQLGFHGYRQDSHWRPVTQNIDEVERDDRAFLQTQGFSAGFLAQAYQVSPAQLWKPERTELLKAGVLTP